MFPRFEGAQAQVRDPRSYSSRDHPQVPPIKGLDLAHPQEQSSSYHRRGRDVQDSLSFGRTAYSDSQVLVGSRHLPDIGQLWSTDILQSLSWRVLDCFFSRQDIQIIGSTLFITARTKGLRRQVDQQGDPEHHDQVPQIEGP